MATNDLGVAYPTGADEFAPHVDMEAMADSLHGRIIVPVANETERDALSADVVPTASTPLYVHRADAADGFKLEVNEGAGFYSVSGASRFRFVTPTASGTLADGNSVDLAATQTIPAFPFGNRPYWVRISGAAVFNCPAPARGIVETLIDGSTWDYNELSTGSGTVQAGVRVARPFLISTPNVTHTARVRLRAAGGTVTVLGPGRIFDIELTPATTF
jgi:hypothetical protein